jgi:hypothetical protein
MKPSDDHDRLADRWEERLRALGTRSPCCSVAGCEETSPFALTGVAPNIVCREHLADQQDRSWIEQHHPAGRQNDSFTVPLPTNEHGVLSEHQALWDRDTLRNPDGSPLLMAAAAIRGWLDVLRLIIERTAGWVPEFLESLDLKLREALGSRWWDEFGWEG